MSHSAPLVFTDNAAKKVYELITEEGDPDLKLRISITGGGCSGFQYVFAFDKAVDLEGDTVITKAVEEGDDLETGEGGAVQLVIDPLSLEYLRDATVDYKEDINGEQFVVTNPNAQTTCGCGSSFSL